jgi:hypothetical protein
MSQRGPRNRRSIPRRSVTRRPVVLLALAPLMLACGDSSKSSCGTQPQGACEQLCEQVCERLEGCAVEWEPSCEDRCARTFTCPGETPDHDQAICGSYLGQIETATCSELCHGTHSSYDWGGDCSGGWDERCSELANKAGDPCPPGFVHCFVDGGFCAGGTCISLPDVGDVQCGSTGYVCDERTVVNFRVSSCQL